MCGGRSQTHEAARHVTSCTGNTADPEAEGGSVVARAEGGGGGKRLLTGAGFSGGLVNVLAPGRDDGRTTSEA